MAEDIVERFDSTRKKVNFYAHYYFSKWNFESLLTFLFFLVHSHPEKPTYEFSEFNKKKVGLVKVQTGLRDLHQILTFIVSY